MARTDLVADALTIVRNAIMAKRDTVDIPASNMLRSIFEILKSQKYIDNIKVIEDKKQGKLRVYLKYTSGKSAIRNIQKISKPGLRVYVDSENIPNVLRGRGLCIISTSKGVITGDEARNIHQGGEVLAYIW